MVQFTNESIVSEIEFTRHLREERKAEEDQLTKNEFEARNSVNKEIIRYCRVQNNICRVEEDIKRNFLQQKTENNRLQNQIHSIKGDKTNLEQQLLGKEYVK
jgi:hypothetical protein